MHKDSIIDVVRDKNHPVQEHIAIITGKPYVPKPTYYRNTVTEETYYHIVGAIAFPSLQQPGFAVIVGALREGEPNEPNLKVLAELEGDHGLEGLLQSCVEIRTKWGFPELLDLFYGDYERYITFLSDFNQKMDRGVEKGIYLCPPNDFQLSNRSEIYIERIRSFLTRNVHGNKRLTIGGCDRLRTHLQSMLSTEIQKQEIEEFPAIAALGYAVHSLASLRPWMQHARRRELVNTYIPDIFDYGHDYTHARYGGE